MTRKWVIFVLHDSNDVKVIYVGLAQVKISICIYIYIYIFLQKPVDLSSNPYADPKFTFYDQSLMTDIQTDPVSLLFQSFLLLVS